MRRQWTVFAIVVISSFAVLGWTGTRIYQEAPPIPAAVVTTDGHQLLTASDIHEGQNVWQSMGGMELGSVWGHGSYVAPDWTADWLHRELVAILDEWAQRDGQSSYASLSLERQASLRARLTTMIRMNTYDPVTGQLTIPAERARAFEANAAHYATVFRDGETAFAIPAGT